jgi:PAS domain S-box-containing protein
MDQKDLIPKPPNLAVLSSLPEKENPLLEIIRLLTEELDDIVYFHDGKGHYSYLSPGVFNLTGYTAEEWKTNAASMYTPNPLNKQGLEYTRKALQTGRKLPSFQLEIYHKDGHPILLEINEMPFIQDGQVTGMIGIARDISERKKLHKLVENYQSFLKANPIPVVIYNLQRMVSYLNPAFEKTFGWNHDELVGQKIPFVPEEEMQATLEHIQKAIDGEESTNFETRRLTKAGEVLEVNITSFRYNDEQGNPAGLVAMYRDVTKRRSLEREIKRRLSFEENLIESTLDGIIAVDRQGLVVLFNQGAARITGYPPEEIIGKRNVNDLYPPGVGREIKKAFWSPSYGGEGKLLE